MASRKVDPQGTRFRAMSYEEQATFLEQVVQEINRHLQGVVAYELDEGISDPKENIEAPETHQESPVQIMDLLEYQAAQERGTLLLQQTEMLMKRMWDDPYLFIGPVVSTVVQSIPTESNDPGSIIPDNAHGLGNLEPTT
jgi:hypothetical protein